MINQVFCLSETGTSHTNRYDRFSIPLRSSHLNLLYVGQVGGLDSESLRSSPLPGFFAGLKSLGLLVFGVWGNAPASLDNLIITTRDRLAKIWLISTSYLRSRGVRSG